MGTYLIFSNIDEDFFGGRGGVAVGALTSDFSPRYLFRIANQPSFATQESLLYGIYNGHLGCKQCDW